jgi:hypothetical protein
MAVSQSMNASHHEREREEVQRGAREIDADRTSQSE